MADANHAFDSASAQANAGASNAGRFTSGADPRRNMRGRPPAGEAFTDYLRELGELTFDELKAMERHIGKLPLKKAMALRQLLEGMVNRGAPMRAVAARVRAYTYNRLDGMPTQAVETTSAADEALADMLDGLGAALREAGGEEASE